MKKSLLLTVFSLSFLLLGAVEVEACSCFGRPQGAKGVQTCGYYWNSEDVFIGTADSVEIDNKVGMMKVIFSVEKAIRGTPEKTVEIYTSGSEASCGYPFKQGERYFVYGRKDKQGRYWESLCGPTTPLKDAEDDLGYAKDIEDGRLGTRIWGSVFEDWQPTLQDERAGKPLGGVEITIKNSKYTFTTVTDENGNYLFKDFPRGPYDIVSKSGVSILDKTKETDRVNFEFYLGGYQVFAKLPKGYRELFTRQDLTEHFAGGCDGESFRVTRQGSIRGRVVNFPSKEIQNPWDPDPAQPKVSLMPLDENGQPFKHYAFEEKWAYRDKFEYFFDTVPAGKYLLAINPNNCSHPNNGIPPMFYPGVATQSEARVITVEPGQQLIVDNFRSLPMLKERWIAGRVVSPEGTPVANAKVQVANGFPGSGPCSDGNFDTRTDTLGMFRIRGYEGYRYSVQAVSENVAGRAHRYSQRLPVPNDPRQELEIVLSMTF